MKVTRTDFVGMASGDTVCNPISRFEHALRRLRGPVGDYHDHFITASAVQEDLIVGFVPCD